MANCDADTALSTAALIRGHSAFSFVTRHAKRYELGGRRHFEKM